MTKRSNLMYEALLEYQYSKMQRIEVRMRLDENIKRKKKRIIFVEVRLFLS